MIEEKIRLVGNKLYGIKLISSKEGYNGKEGLLVLEMMAGIGMV